MILYSLSNIKYFYDLLPLDVIDHDDKIVRYTTTTDDGHGVMIVHVYGTGSANEGGR